LHGDLVLLGSPASEKPRDHDGESGAENGKERDDLGHRLIVQAGTEGVEPSTQVLETLVRPALVPKGGRGNRTLLGRFTEGSRADSPASLPAPFPG
jgi:hypothetical protein